MSISQNLLSLQTEIKNSGREVVLVAVSKTKPINLIEEAISAGQKVFGENKIKEGIEKFSDLKTQENLTLHHLGPVQSGTAKKLFGVFDFTHGVSSHSTIELLLKEAEKQKKLLKYFLQVNLTDEDSKNGFSESDLLAILNKTNVLENEYLRFEGLMTMGPTSEDPTLTRSVFQKLNAIRKSLVPLAKLSMGMSGDYKIALEEETDYIRVGSLLFGSRE
jgi:pyridoxal phosphate enzyme (YggS family)